MMVNEFACDKRNDPTPVSVSLIIVTYERMDLLRLCLEAVRDAALSVPYEMIVVDNGSRTWDRQIVLDLYPGAVLIENESNHFYARANNQGMSIAQGKYFLLLNSDAFLRPGSIEPLLELMESNPRIGAVGPAIVGLNGVQQSCGARRRRCSDILINRLRLPAILPRRLAHSLFPWAFWSWKESHRVDWVTGACWLLRASAIRTAGYLDEGFKFYCEDDEWCYRATKKGWEIWYAASSPVLHCGGASTSEPLDDVAIDSTVRLWHKTSGVIYGTLFHMLRIVDFQISLLFAVLGSLIGKVESRVTLVDRANTLKAWSRRDMKTVSKLITSAWKRELK